MINNVLTVSVITVTWNSVDSLSDCLASAGAQSWVGREHLVVDGVSRDGTLSLLFAHRDQLAVILSEPDEGIYDALNKGLALATGEVVGFLHADDVLAGPDVLQWVAEAFADPAVDAVYGDLEYVAKDDLSRVIRYWRAGSFKPSRLAWGWMPPHPTLYVRRSWYDKLGVFDTRYRIAGDYEFMLRLFSQPGFKAIYIPRVLVKMRVGGASNRSLRNILRKSKEDLHALRCNGVGGWGTLVCKNLRKLGQFLV